MSGSDAVFDRSVMLAELGGDEALLAELVEAMRSEAPKLLHELRVAVDAEDPVEIRHTAHTLKGAVLSFAAPSAAAALLHLEQIGRSGDLAHAAAALEVVEAQMQVLLEALDES